MLGVYIGVIGIRYPSGEIEQRQFPCISHDEALSVLEKNIAIIIESPNLGYKINNVQIDRYHCGVLKEVIFYNYNVDATITLDEQ